MDLLFVMAHWHGLAKLRLHTDETLDLLDELTSDLGDRLRAFDKKTCAAFQTQELPKETRARNREEVRRADKGKGKAKAAGNDKSGYQNQAEPQVEIPTSNRKSNAFQPKSDRHAKDFSLHTYKAHSLGDYADMIRRYGTVDSYNTEMVSQVTGPQMLEFTRLIFQGELEHRNPKARYRRTSKKHFVKQLSRIERRQARIRRIRDRYLGASKAISSVESNTTISPEAHHHIGKSQNEYEPIGAFLLKNAEDPAIEVIISLSQCSHYPLTVFFLVV